MLTLLSAFLIFWAIRENSITGIICTTCLIMFSILVEYIVNKED